LTITFQHDEGRALVGKPAESSKRNQSIVADDDQPAQPVSHTGKAKPSALRPDPIFDAEMPGLHRDADAESVKCQNAMFGDLRSNRRVR
jgi:hypothetical protein